MEVEAEATDPKALAVELAGRAGFEGAGLPLLGRPVIVHEPRLRAAVPGMHHTGSSPSTVTGSTGSVYSRVARICSVFRGKRGNDASKKLVGRLVDEGLAQLAYGVGVESLAQGAAGLLLGRVRGRTLARAAARGDRLAPVREARRTTNCPPRRTEGYRHRSALRGAPRARTCNRTDCRRSRGRNPEPGLPRRHAPPPRPGTPPRQARPCPLPRPPPWTPRPHSPLTQ